MAKSNNNNGFNNNNTNDLISFVSREAGYAPPQAIDMEEAILGAVMIEKEAVHDIVDILRADAFYLPEHQKIYSAVLRLYNELQPIDIYTVGDMLKRSGELDEIGGAAKLAQLTNRVGSASHVEYHAKIVAQKYIQRELIRSSIEIQKNSFDENLDVTDLIDFAEGKIFKVSEGFVRRDVRTSYDILKEAMKTIEKAGENKGGINGVATGFRDLDRLTSGWQPSDLIIIAARPSMGKTAFVLSLARNATIDYETPVALFSLEMNDIQLITRLIVSESELDSLKIKNGDLTKN
ncbi:MAG: DnaB-like helicase C-terminal domain-containing protein, partial [Rikenellaceae bacterium]